MQSRIMGVVGSLLVPHLRAANRMPAAPRRTARLVGHPPATFF